MQNLTSHLTWARHKKHYNDCFSTTYHFYDVVNGKDMDVF
jgi:hypothetical protein